MHKQFNPHKQSLRPIGAPKLCKLNKPNVFEILLSQMEDRAYLGNITPRN